MLTIRNARVLPDLTLNYDGDRADIVIDNGQIVDILVPGQPVSGEYIEADGKTLLPGFIDAHVHLDLSGEPPWEENTQSDAYRVMHAVKLAQDALKMGFTTLRDLGDRNDIIIDLMNAVNAGFCLGPRILASGRIITPTEPGNEYFGTMYLEADSRDEIVKSVRTQIKAGACWIKYMGSGAVMNPGGEPGFALYTEEELRWMVDTAQTHNIPVAGHAHGAQAVKNAVRAGVRTIEHATLIDDEGLELLKGNETSYIIPTMLPFAAWSTGDVAGAPAHYVEKSKKLFGYLCEYLNKAYTMGLKIGLGSDAGVYPGSHGGNAMEFIYRNVHAGMKPIDILMQATKYNAEILRIDDLVGTIEVGKRADLVLFDGQPDVDLKAVERVECVIRDGAVVCL